MATAHPHSCLREAESLPEAAGKQASKPQKWQTERRFPRGPENIRCSLRNQGSCQKDMGKQDSRKVLVYQVECGDFFLKIVDNSCSMQHEPSPSLMKNSTFSAHSNGVLCLLFLPAEKYPRTSLPKVPCTLHCCEFNELTGIASGTDSLHVHSHKCSSNIVFFAVYFASHLAW